MQGEAIMVRSHAANSEISVVQAEKLRCGAGGPTDDETLNLPHWEFQKSTLLG
jgi:hypothetical protein